MYRPFSLGGHVESQENKKLCFCTVNPALNSHVGEANRAKTKLFILLRLNMAAEWERSIALKSHPTNPPFVINNLFIHLGPAESLFQESYYELMKKALKPDGLLCCQGILDFFTWFETKPCTPSVCDWSQVLCCAARDVVVSVDYFLGLGLYTLFWFVPIAIRREKKKIVNRVSNQTSKTFGGKVCCSFLSLLRGFSQVNPVFPPSTKTNTSKFQFQRERTDIFESSFLVESSLMLHG